MVNSEEISFTDTSQLCEDISALYLNEKFSDLTLILDGQKLHAHKVILAARSEHFQNLLYNGSEESVQKSQTEVTISDAAPEAFRKLLKYIYTGSITVSSNIELSLEILALVHQYSLKNLESGLIKNLKSVLNLKNICAILNTANLYELEDLRDACHSFMDVKAQEIVAGDCINHLTQKSMIKLLERDTFFVPEIEIFKIVAKWCASNNDVDGLVIQCVRFSWLSVVEIVSIVWPSKLVNCDLLLRSIAEIVDVKPKTTNSRAILVIDENLASLNHKAQAIFGTKTDFLLSGTGNISNYAYHAIDGKSNITLKLGAPSYINHIDMGLWDNDSRYYSYYIEVSVDQKKWLKVIDYSQFSCRSRQNLYFETQIAQYIKIVGTHNSDHPMFHLISFETYFKTKIPKIANGIISPDSNVATVDKKAVVIEGGSPNDLINGDFKHYTGNTGFSHHTIGSGHLVVQLAQPYLISSVRLLLWDLDDRSYRYFVETSTNKIKWETAVDRRNEDCKSWQNLHFKERVVVFVRITGTQNTANDGFHCVHFECPSGGDE